MKLHTKREDVIKVEWAFGDSIVQYGEHEIYHLYPSRGSYTVGATVTYRDSTTASFTLSFTF